MINIEDFYEKFVRDRCIVFKDFEVIKYITAKQSIIITKEKCLQFAEAYHQMRLDEIEASK